MKLSFLHNKKILIGISVIFLIGIGVAVIFLLKPSSQKSRCKIGEYMCESGISKNNCIPSNFCSDSGLINNKDNCSCAIACPEGSTSFPIDAGMRLNNGKWEPSQTLLCGKACEYDPLKFCKDDTYYCGQVIDADGRVDNQGCLKKDGYHQCSENVFCPTGIDCTKDKLHCDFNYCGKTNPSNVYACTEDTDCHDGTTSGTCKKGDQTLKLKQIDQVGYCDPSKKLKMPVNDMCVDISQIGQHKDTFGKYYVAPCSKQDEEGVNVDIQCSDALENNCAKNRICPNGWQADISSDTSHSDSNCIDGTYNPSKPPLCCTLKAQITDKSGTKFCCPEETQDCHSQTKYGYSKNMLGISDSGLTDTIPCPNGDECEGHNSELWASLGLSNPPDQTAQNYAYLYCDKEQLICKANCGFISTSDGKVQPDYSITNVDPSASTGGAYSYCIPKSLNCQLDTAQRWLSGYEPVNDITICYPPPPSGGSIDPGQLVWSNIGAGDSQKYISEFTQTLSGSDCKNNMICGESSAIMEGVYKVESDGKKCKYTINCSSSLVQPTGATESLQWSQLSDPNYLNQKITDSSQFLEKIYQTRQGTALKDGGCEGDSKGFTPELTTSPQTRYSTDQSCSPSNDVYSGMHFSYNGKFCKLNQYGECK
jgi:hypothetical protein